MIQIPLRRIVLAPASKPVTLKRAYSIGLEKKLLKYPLMLLRVPVVAVVELAKCYQLMLWKNI
jgi:hypothetical protein